MSTSHHSAHPDESTTPGPIEERSDRHEYLVAGMTCAHCVASVREEVGELPDVEVLDVDLASGRLVVAGDAAGAREPIAAAVEEAGYVLEAESA